MLIVHYDVVFADLSLAVPVTNALTLVFTAVAGRMIGEHIGPSMHFTLVFFLSTVIKPSICSDGRPYVFVSFFLLFWLSTSPKPDSRPGAKLGEGWSLPGRNSGQISARSVEEFGRERDFRFPPIRLTAPGGLTLGGWTLLQISIYNTLSLKVNKQHKIIEPRHKFKCSFF